MGFLSNSKDRLVEKMVLPVLNNSLLQPYGKAIKLQIDSSSKNVRLVLQLFGESEPVQIEILDYLLKREGDCAHAIIKQIQTSRAWLTTLAERYLVGRPLELPPRVAAVLFRLL